MSRFYVANQRVGPDLPLADEELNLGGGVDRLWFGCGDKETTGTEVPNWGDIVSIVATPANRDAFGHVDTGSVPSGKGGPSYEMFHRTPERPARRNLIGYVGGQVMRCMARYSETVVGATQKSNKKASVGPGRCPTYVVSRRWYYVGRVVVLRRWLYVREEEGRKTFAG